MVSSELGMMQEKCISHKLPLTAMCRVDRNRKAWERGVWGPVTQKWKKGNYFRRL